MLVAAATVVAGVISVPANASASTSEVRVASLKTNGRTEPLGIPGGDPVFGWASTSDRRGVTQTAYKIQVGSAAGRADVWDSGKVASRDQVDIAYEGPGLASGTRYFWRVKVWDDRGAGSDWSEPTWFETGLLSASDWGTAQWIGKAAPQFAKWDDYVVKTRFKVNAVALGLMLRSDANFTNGYLWQVARSTTNPTYAILKPHVKAGSSYAATTVELQPFGITWDSLINGYHDLEVRVTGDQFVTSIDGTQVDSRSYSNHARGQAGFRASYSGSTPESFSLTSFSVTRSTGEELAASDFSAENSLTAGTTSDGTYTLVGVTKREVYSAYKYAAGPDDNAPLIRKSFDLDPTKQLADARVYASAQGIYELTLNGEDASNSHLAPGFTNYNHRIQSQTYDITELLTPGRNVLGVELGNGWFTGSVGVKGINQFGTKNAFVGRIKLTYTDGSVQWIDTDTTWKATNGPLVSNDLQNGEVYDAQYEKPGWNTVTYDDSSWRPVVASESATAKLVPQPDAPVRTLGELPTVTASDPVPGTRIYDLGQNMVGVAKLRLTGAAGETARIRYGEVLYTSYYGDKEGHLYTDNLRKAQATDHYTFAPSCGSSCTIEYTPKFTQHGFRYVEVSGLAHLPAAEDVTGVVWGSDLERVGDLTTSSSQLNQLTSNVYWGARGNFLSIPTDTPARDERMGWMGDISVFAPTAGYLFDSRAFLGKWMTDLSGEQRLTGTSAGSFPPVAPYPVGIGVSGQRSFGWEDAAVTVPYAMYRATGDLGIVRDNWATMERFIAYVMGELGDDNIDPDLGRCGSGPCSDWLNLNDPTSRSLLSTAISAEDLRMMAELAEAIGDPDAAAYAARHEAVREAFTAKFVAADGSVQGGPETFRFGSSLGLDGPARDSVPPSQTAYAVALGMELITDPQLRQKAADKFVAKLAENDNHLTTGFLGVSWLLPALSSIGRDDLAFEVLMQNDYPGWLFEISQGATTVWERWNSIDENGKFGDVSMNSFNHFAYGAVLDWVQQHVGGIRIDEPGYRTSIIDPHLGAGLTEAKNEIKTVYGPLSSEWKADGDDLTLDVTIPVNTTSRVRIPTPDGHAVTEAGTALAEGNGVTDVDYDADAEVTTVTVGSGTYHFAVHESLQAPELSAVVSVEARCVDQKTMLAVSAVNANEVPVTVELTTPYGAKTFANVAPGKSVFHSFTTRLRDMPSGAVDATVTSDADAAPPAGTVTQTYSGRIC
ncbi:family 78 glycoside hydrolase catalytic domain [Streptomyces sp. NPDC053750]|uniref:family 78 glycoside hydrolase catalytic domain n=1 Tax=Streptomyces sp. NPDC053750 TaxID=3365714 RepID=UPI0037CD15E1